MQEQSDSDEVVTEPLADDTVDDNYTAPDPKREAGRQVVYRRRFPSTTRPGWWF